MSDSIEQVIKRRGRPPKSGDSAMGGAARSKEYRLRETVKAQETLAELRDLATVLALVVLATSERGAMVPKVQKVLEDNPRAAKYMHGVLKHGMNTVQNKKRLVKTLEVISNSAKQLDLLEFIAAMA